MQLSKTEEKVNKWLEAYSPEVQSTHISDSPMPSKEKRWMKYYPDAIANMQVPVCTLNDYIKNQCKGEELTALHYYGNDITYRTIFEQSELVAKALKALGIGLNDQIPVFFRNVPEFVILLLAAEKIGASLLCRDNLPEENAYAVERSGSSVVFAHDFLPQADIEAIEATGVEKFIILSPYHSAVESTIAPNIKREIDKLYEQENHFTVETLDWDDFVELGRKYEGDYLAEEDTRRPLFRCYTSGSTGTSKQVIHCASTVTGVISQMTFFGASDEFRPTVLACVLPPALVAVVISFDMMPLASNKLLIMDPFVAVEDIYLELERYKPQICYGISMFISALVNNPNITEDYDLSFLYSLGAGAESFNNMQIRRAQQFLNDHGSKCVLTVGYGCSEVGSNATFQLPNLGNNQYSSGNGNIGIPMPLNVAGIFRPDSTQELGYMEIGEICFRGPGVMLGYDDPDKTAKALVRHEDGITWYHTGDYGYVDENGVFFCLGRGNTPRKGGGYLSEIMMENRVADANIRGIKDVFFVITHDPNEPVYYDPYLFVILKDGFEVADIEDEVRKTLMPFEQPVKIFKIAERPFFHFKTARINLALNIIENKATVWEMDQQ